MRFSLWVLGTLQRAGKEPSPGVRVGLLSFLLCMYSDTVLGHGGTRPAVTTTQETEAAAWAYTIRPHLEKQLQGP